MCNLIKVPSERLNPTQVRKMAMEHWGLTKEQMVGMEVHHYPPRCEGGKDIPEHLYVCSKSMHRYGWHNDEWFMQNLEKATKSNIGRKHSEETCRKKSIALKGRVVGTRQYGADNYISKPVKINGKSYVSQTEAARDIGITIQGITYRMRVWGVSRGYEYL